MTSTHDYDLMLRHSRLV